MIGAVILAAGEGRRLGGRNKALLVWQGEGFLARIGRVAGLVGVGEVVVVVAAPHRGETVVEATRLGFATVDNPDPGRGMGSSVAIGFAHAVARFASDAAFLWPVDHPAVADATLAGLIEAARTDRWLIPRHRGRAGHPVLIGRDLWPALARRADGPMGARGVRDEDPSMVLGIEVDDAGVVADVDQASDLP